MEKSPQPPERMTHGGGRQIELVRRTRDVVLLQHSAKYHQKTDVDAGKLSRIQHDPETLSLAS